VTVAKEIEFSDKYMNIGASLIKEVASKTNDEAGDGTTTATVLARYLFKEGCKAVAAGMNPMDVRKGIQLAVDAVIEKLKEMSIPVKGKQEIENVATISANGDKNVGSLIASIYEKSGKDATVTVTEGKTLKTEVEMVEGLKFDRGFISPYFITDPKAGKVELTNPKILLVDKKISSIQSIIHLLEHCVQTNSSILIVAEDLDTEPIATLIVNKIKAGFRVCAVKAPSFGDNRKATLEDIAISCGAQVVSEDLGMQLEKTDPSILGSAKQVIVTKDDTIIMHGAGAKADVDSRISSLKELKDKSNSTYDKEKLDERIGRLTGGVAVIKVGGASEVEVNELKDRINDALCATKAASEEGIVPGGGMALLHCSKALDKLKGENFDQNHGIEIVQKACRIPCKAICDNAGYEGSVIVDKSLAEGKPHVAFDAAHGIVVNMIDNGVIDPTKVVRSALVNASGVASMMITTEAAIVEEPKAEKEKPQMPPMGSY
jgi:chaperonin GroEL